MLNRSRFEDQGFLMVPGLVDPRVDLDPVLADYDLVLDDLIEEQIEATRRPAEWRDLPFGERVKLLYRETGGLYAQHFNISVPPQARLPRDIPICLADSIFRLLTHARLLDAVEALVGPEIRINPVQHVRIKPPEKLLAAASDGGAYHGALRITKRNGLMARTPWHQDNAVLTPDADETEMVTVWLPLTAATEEMGCLKLLPESHKAGLLTHCPGGTTDLSIPDALVSEARAVTLPMQRGDALFLHKRILHASLPNRSDAVRFSLDLRFQQDGRPTGRAVLPSFLARSRSRPHQTVSDPETWRAGWRDAIADLSEAAEVPPPNRWNPDAELCA